MSLLNKIFKKNEKESLVNVDPISIDTNMPPETKDETIIETKNDTKIRTSQKRDLSYSIITDQRLKILKALRNRQLKHSQIEKMVSLSRGSSYRQLKVLMDFGYIERIELETPSISGKSSCFDIHSKRIKKKAAYFYDLTKKGINALTYWGVED